MSAITTHVLDVSRGEPAAGVAVTLEFLTGMSSGDSRNWKVLGRGVTDADGRLTTLLSQDTRPSRGHYRLTFLTHAYFFGRNVKTFYPYVTVDFQIQDTAAHYHIPLLISPYGYSTYRGS